MPEVYHNFETGDKVMKCPSCDCEQITTIWVDHKFQYGTDEDHVMLDSRVPLRTCLNCSEKWLDCRAEEIMAEVVELHLKPAIVVDDEWKAAAEKALLKADVYSLQAALPLMESFKVPIEDMDEWCAQSRLDYPCHFTADLKMGLG
jgi:hypothetical protein